MKEYLSQYEYFEDKSLLKSFIGSMAGGVAISVMMSPFDLIMTRLYNQRRFMIRFQWRIKYCFVILATDEKGRGKMYAGYMDCVSKIYKTEGMAAFYKGIGPMYLRLGPHSVLCLVFWDEFTKVYETYFQKKATQSSW